MAIFFLTPFLGASNAHTKREDQRRKKRERMRERGSRSHVSIRERRVERSPPIWRLETCYLAPLSRLHFSCASTCWGIASGFYCKQKKKKCSTHLLKLHSDKFLLLFTCVFLRMGVCLTRRNDCVYYIRRWNWCFCGGEKQLFCGQ